MLWLVQYANITTLSTKELNQNKTIILNQVDQKVFRQSKANSNIVNKIAHSKVAVVPIKTIMTII